MMRAYSYHKNPEGLERGWWYFYVEDGRRSELYGPHDSRVLAGEATIRATELAREAKQESSRQVPANGGSQRPSVPPVRALTEDEWRGVPPSR